MNKHTPGPWAPHYDNRWNQWSVRSANTADLAEAPIYYELADRIGGHVRGKNFDDYSEVEANARLIAAAPDLLEALDEAVKDLVATQFNARTAARADKAWSGVSEAIQPSVDKARAAIAKARGEA